MRDKDRTLPCFTLLPPFYGKIHLEKLLFFSVNKEPKGRKERIGNRVEKLENKLIVLLNPELNSCLEQEPFEKQARKLHAKNTPK